MTPVNFFNRSLIRYAFCNRQSGTCGRVIEAGCIISKGVVSQESIRKVGPERCILSTDLGQPINPPVAEGFAMFAEKLLDNGFSLQEVRRMAVTNPAAWVE